MPDISILILNWNTRDLLAACLDSIARTCGDLNIETIVLDNASTDDSQDMLRARYPGVRLIANKENVGFARGNNQAAAASRGKYVLLLNSDAELHEGALGALCELVAQNPTIGAVGARLCNPDGSFQASHTHFPTQLQEFLILSGLGRKLLGQWYPSRGPEEDKGPQMVDYVEGACILLRKSAYEQVGGMDGNFFMYAEEVDLCYSLKQRGWEVWYHPQARVLHHGGASSRHRRTQREGDLYQSRVRFFRKHYGNLPAELLKGQIYAFTLFKIILHSLLKTLTGGRRGRPVISLRELAEKFQGV